MPAHRETIAVVSVGAMGAAIGGALGRKGIPVVTCLTGRSARTVAAAMAAGIEVVGSLSETVRRADMVLSVVPPDEASGVATAIAAAAESTGARPILADCNSVSPATIERIEATCEDAGLPFADVAIRGGAERLGTMTRAYVCGPAADEVAAVLGLVTEVEHLGPEAGRASGLKMALAGVAKGIAALVLESGVASYRDGLLDPFLTDVDRFYPGAIAALERVAPGYAASAGRRAAELEEAVTHARSLGADPVISRAIAMHLERVAEATLGEVADARELIAAFSRLGCGVPAAIPVEGSSL